MKIKKLIKLLEKRAKGFSYKEVQEEFALDASCVESSEQSFKQEEKTLFDLALETKEDEATGLKNFGAESLDCKQAVLESPPKRKRGRPKKNKESKPVIKKCDEKGQDSVGMLLVKRKVHTFFVPPDMTAIKMLIEFEGRPTSTEDDVVELAEKRRALLKEIKKELLGEEADED